MGNKDRESERVEQVDVAVNRADEQGPRNSGKNLRKQKKSKFKQAREKQKRKSEADKEGQYNLSARIVAVHCQRHDQPSDVDMSDKPRLQK